MSPTSTSLISVCGLPEEEERAGVLTIKTNPTFGMPLVQFVTNSIWSLWPIDL